MDIPFTNFRVREREGMLFFPSTGRDLVTHELPQWFRSAWDCRFYHSSSYRGKEGDQLDCSTGIVTRLQPIALECPGKERYRGDGSIFLAVTERSRLLERTPGKINII